MMYTFIRLLQLFYMFMTISYHAFIFFKHYTIHYLHNAYRLQYKVSKLIYYI